MKKVLSFKKAVENYLQCRRQLGFVMKQEGPLLRSLAEYLGKKHPGGPLTIPLALAWAQLPRNARRLWWAYRLNAARRFAQFWVCFDSRTEVPPARFFGPAARRGPVHIYTPKEIKALLVATAQLGPAQGWRSNLYRTLLGLLACTGLRISEALRLCDQDVDCDAGLLTVQCTKGGQARCLPLQASTVSALRAYRQLRQRLIVQPKRPAFFLTVRGTAPHYKYVAANFRELCRSLGWTRQPLPRLHDLRHTFAVNCLIGWHRRNQEGGSKILSLSTYLGHRRVSDTYWYLTAVPQLLKLSNQRFEASRSRL